MTDSVLVISVGILTVSDTCFTGDKFDTSGPHIEKLLACKRFNFKVAVIRRRCAPDDIREIQTVLKQWCDYNRLDLILTVGGTGTSTRDITPEATKLIINYEMENLASVMVRGCLKKTALSILSRGTCGIRHETLIINLPGSLKGSQECFEEIAPFIKCAIINVRNDSYYDDELHNSKCMGFDTPQEDKCESNVDISRVAERPRQSKYPMLSVENALDVVLHHSDTLSLQSRNFSDCFSYILAERIVAKEPYPLFPASIKDGYAVIAEDSSDVRNVIGNCTPGYVPDCTVSFGNCIRVSTGGAIPNGANAVVQVEDTVIIEKDKEGKEELKIKVLKQVVHDQDIRGIGSDIAKGECVIHSRTKVLAPQIGVMAMIGIQSAFVFEKPWVALLSTGNELVEPDSCPQPGGIRDSNKSSLMYILSQCCIPFLDLGIAKDTPSDVKNRLMLALESADVVVSTGGVSMGERDCLKEVLKLDFDGTIHFGRVHMKPGKPTTFSTVNFNGKKKLVFCLPGNPVSAYVTFHLFVLPCLRKMMGYKNPENKVIKAKISHDLNLDERPEFHRASIKYCNDTLTYIATSTGKQQSSRLPSMIGADALLVLPPRCSQQNIINNGAIVDVLLLEYI